MFQLYAYSFLATFLFTPLGSFFLKNERKDLEFFSYQLIFGIILTSFIGLLLNFIFPLNTLINSPLLLISAYIIIKNKKIYLDKNYIYFSIISASIIYILIAESNTYRPDAGLYHLPYISILNNEKIIIGLSNLHFRFGHISIIQYFSAISNNIIFNLNGIVFGSALIASSVIIYFLSVISKKFYNKIYDLEFYFIFAIILFIFYKLNRYSNYGNDAPAHFLYYFLILQILIQFKNFDYNKYTNTLLLSVFIFMSKLTLSIACLVPLLLLKKKYISHIIKSKKTYFIICFLSLWLLKNILTTGCLIYPVINTCVDKFSWTDIKTAKYISYENEAWAKNWPDTKINIDHKQYIKDFVWLKDWKKNYLPKFLKIIIPYLILLFFLIIYLSFTSNKKKVRMSNKVYLIFLLLTISLILWFLKFPILRYGQSFIISLLALIFGVICCRYEISKKSKKIFVSLIFIGILIFASKNFLRIYKSSNNYHNYPWPKYLSVHSNNKPQKQIQVIIDGKKFYKAKEGICMYSEPLCSGMERKFNLKYINSYLVLFREK